MDDTAVETPEPRKHGKRHRWGFADAIEGATYARRLDQSHDIHCEDCGLRIPGPVYREAFEKLAHFRDLSIDQYMEKQDQLLEIVALEYEDEPRDET